MSEPLGRPSGLLGCSGEGSWGLRGILGELLGDPWGALGASLGAPGVDFGELFEVQGGSWSENVAFRKSLFFLRNINDFEGLRHPKYTLRGCLEAYFEHAGARASLG